MESYCFWHGSRWAVERRRWSIENLHGRHEIFDALTQWERPTHWKPSEIAVELADKMHASVTGACSREPRDLQIEVFSEFPEEWGLAEFKGMIQAAEDRIPLDCRDGARVKTGLYGKVTIYYTRRETPEEVAANIDSAIKRASEQHGISRDQYERLCAQFAFLW